MENFLVITEFLSATEPINHENASFFMKKRTSAALIFPLYGKLEFSWGDASLTADSEHPIFIPEGACYQNTCKEEAKSLMFNLKVQGGADRIVSLLPPDGGQLRRIYEEITLLYANPTAKKRAAIFGRLYWLLGECLPAESGDGASLLSPALERMEREYHRADLSLDHLASVSHISKSYLHVLFQKEFGMTPFQYLTRVRMRQAEILLSEGYRVCEVAAMVGYSDVYQFSRAFKRFYRCAPSKMK